MKINKCWIKMSVLHSLWRTQMLSLRVRQLRKCSSMTQTAQVKTKEKSSEKIIQKSSLVIIGDRSHAPVSVVKPDIDVETLLSAEYEENLKARGIKVDLKMIIEGLRDTVKLRIEKENLEKERSKTIEELNVTNSASVEHGELMKKNKHLRDEIKKINNKLWEIEDDISLPMINLTNKLHKETPRSESRIIHVYSSPPTFDFKIKNHVEIGAENNEIIFSNISPTAYYFQQKTAELELRLTNYLRKTLSENQFELISNPDFCKPVLAESCGLGYLDEIKSFVLNLDGTSNQAHLTGGASLPNFYGMYTRRILEDKKFLPIRHFTIGRHYKPVTRSNENNLFNTTQSSGIDVFVLTEKNEEEIKKEFDRITELIKNIYEDFNIHFRIVRVCCHDLNCTESLKNVFQMWSPSLNNFVDVGFVSFYGDFISRRLMSRYKDDNEQKYLQAIHGTLLNVTSFIACVMENMQNGQGIWEMKNC